MARPIELHTKYKSDLELLKTPRPTMKLGRVDQLTAAHMGISSISPFAHCISSSRLLMGSTQLASKQTLVSPDRKHTSCGFGDQLGKYTYNVVVPCDLQITHISRRSSGSKTPETRVFYVSEETGELGVIELPNFIAQKTVFGTKYQKTEAYKTMAVGKYLSKGTVLLDSIATINGGYDFGVNLNLALISMEETVEDGVVLNEECLEKLAYYTYDDYTIEIKPHMVLLNLYGDENTYLSLPEIGDKVGEDGILAAVRSLDISKERANTDSEFTAENLAELTLPLLTHKHLRTIRHHTDIVPQIGAHEGAIIEDIQVMRGYNPNKKKGKIHVEYAGWHDQLDSLAVAQNQFRMEAYDELKRFRRRKNIPNNVSKETVTMHNVCFDAICRNVNYNEDGSVPNQKARSPNSFLTVVKKRKNIESYVVIITVRKLCVPSLADKVTDLFSAKGVITAILPASRMPVDENGRVADICCSIEATINRSIVGRLEDTYISDALRTATEYIRDLLDIHLSMGKRGIARRLNMLFQDEPELIDEALLYIHDLYLIINEFQAETVRDHRDDRDLMYQFLEAALTLELSVQLPTELLSRLGEMPVEAVLEHGLDVIGNKGGVGIINQLEKSKFKPHYGRVSYEDRMGNIVSPVEPCRISPGYYILLDKTAKDYSVANDVILQAMNFTASISKADKQVAPVNRNPVSSLGPDESIILSAIMTPIQLASWYDKQNNPGTIKHVMENIYKIPALTLNHDLVDRTRQKLGSTTAIRLVRHVYAGYGAVLKFRPEPTSLERAEYTIIKKDI